MTLDVELLLLKWSSEILTDTDSARRHLWLQRECTPGSLYTVERKVRLD